ncbi:CRISPR-associated helicase Cas3' [Kitasatospora sp. NPDC093806]|uniref:CRISPR-associated helicase Cas3' n=1 Tax=Kitasatospora sp. NPDC093806 TaxID=3155075 RepID=UPI0034256D8F
MTVHQFANIPSHHAIWAKTDQRSKSRSAGGPAWNPLTAHALDTAACVGQLWDRYLTPGIRSRLAQAFGADDDAAARLVVMLLAALHDLGKGSGCFLRQFGTGRHDRANLLRGQALSDWLRLAADVGLPRDPDPNAQVTARHEHVTAAHLPRLLGCTGADCAGSGPCHPGLHTVALLLGGHHGHIPGTETVERAFGAAPFERWKRPYRALVTEVAELIGAPPLGELPRLIRPERPSVLPLFAGLVVLADWLASSEDHFTFRRLEEPPAAWWAASRRQAERAVDALLLDKWNADPVGWPNLFPGTEPRPLQAAALAALPRSGPALVIVESDTGSGKTRLALAVAHALALGCGHQGVYFALPTRAAANQIGAELREFVARASGGAGIANLAVVHADAEGTDLVHRLLAGTRTAQQSVLDALHDSIDAATCADTTPERPNDHGFTQVVLHPWYLRRCLGLVSTFAIGTVDQVVLAPQPSRHWMLRMLGLAGKVVVIDEAHAYQLFQQSMLRAAVEWLADAGASVVVLSATLPASVHRLLTQAWCTGRQRTLSDGEQHGHGHRHGPITVVDRHGVLTRSGASALGAPRRAEVRLASDPGPERLARHLLAEATNGGITAVVRNRVDAAIELHTAVRGFAGEYGWAEDEIVLLHGRLMGRDRLPIEDRLVRLLGPGPRRDRPNPQRPGRLLVIATQIVEQSLDIDFDRLYTDLAPVDLLLQRRGRLWRHPLNRPPGGCPLLTVLWRPDGTGLPLVEPPGNPDGHVYAPYTLAATWHALHRRADPDGVFRLVTPEHSRALIEEVYGPDRAPAPGPLTTLLARTHAAWQSDLAREYAHASVTPFRPYGPSRAKPVKATGLTSGGAHSDGDGGTHTGATGIAALSRLGEPTVEFLALYRQPDHALTLTYDRAGHLPVTTPDRLHRDRNLNLNTLAIPAHWTTTGPHPLPPPETWPTLHHHPVATFEASTGECLSGPLGLTYDPVHGFSRRPPS